MLGFLLYAPIAGGHEKNTGLGSSAFHVVGFYYIVFSFIVRNLLKVILSKNILKVLKNKVSH